MTRNINLVTIITGASRGIGRVMALRMAKETSVLAVGRTEAELSSLCEEIRKAGGSADYVVGDVADPATADATMAKALANKWTVQNLVCNAGIGKGGVSHSFDKDLWKEIFAVNVNGTFWFTQACLPGMVERKSGNICIISSTAGLKGMKYDAAYCASKHALVGLAKSLALEYAKHGIVVVPVCPGFVESEMTDRTIAGLVKHQSLTPEAARAKVAKTNPQNRIIPAAEVADAVALVCSGALVSLNGHPLVLTGGS